MKRISLNELAKQLNVSKTLVSLVLNEKGDAYGISKATQKRVIRKAAELNYRPNLMARGLRNGKSNVIAVIVADISNPFYSKISRSIEDSASRLGFQIIVSSTEENIIKEQRLVEMLVNEQNVNGIIVASTQNSSAKLNAFRRNGLPVVLIDRNLPNAELDYVGVDNYQGAYEATRHLLSLGYKKIGLLKISPSFLSTIKERTRGYEDALKDHGIRPDPQLIREIPFATMRSSTHREVRSLIAPPKSIEALFVVNSNLAAFAFEYIHETGLRVPQDIAVISFDDVEYFRFSNPPVTAVAQPLEEIGTKAVEMLMHQLNNKNKKIKPEKIKLETELIVRKSCGAFLKRGNMTY
ncbi:MAG: LacI family DNA-binding transcriptional regulator [Bacteroidetes bacterium]|nr:LacI family DNA-binding transcriptional regulator [Bacteroidota bacterium]